MHFHVNSLLRIRSTRRVIHNFMKTISRTGRNEQNASVMNKKSPAFAGLVKAQ